MPLHGHRRLLVIMGLSLALHGILFGSLSWQRQPKAALPTIVATLRLVADTSVGAAKPEIKAAPPSMIERVPESTVAANTAAQPKARPKAERVLPMATPVIATARPANASAQAVPAAGAEPASTAAAAPVQAAASNVPAASASAHVPPVAAAPSDARRAEDALMGYRQRLTNLFAGRYEYPRLAAIRGWEGEVRLRLKVARKGNLLGVVLDRSSGYEVLDRAALALIEGHGDLPPLPEGLDANEISVIVPINYKLRKTT